LAPVVMLAVCFRQLTDPAAALNLLLDQWVLPDLPEQPEQLARVA
jgi:hypothetical protein